MLEDGFDFSLPVVGGASSEPTGDGCSPSGEGCSSGFVVETPRERRRLPRWLKRPLPKPGMFYTSRVIDELKLETVGESAKCPNRTECW